MGKILGFLIGLSIGGPIGAIIGLMIGHFFDKGRSRIYHNFDPTQRARVEETFFNTIFPLLGHLAKADGRISEAEIDGTEQLMAKMQLSESDRRRAIALFKQGSAPGFDAGPVLTAFNLECGRYANLKQILLVYLISLALADGSLKGEEKRILQSVASALGYSATAFNHILRMAIAQNHFYHYGQQGGFEQGGQYQQQSSKTELATAYEALGVDAGISDSELKKAYRRLMSEYHPDKLSGRGVPEDMIAIATDRAQEIQAAYDLIKKHRNL